MNFSKQRILKTLCIYLSFKTFSAIDTSILGPPIIPQPRALHTSVVLKDLMIVYGGIDGLATDPYKTQPLNDLLVFNLTSKLWYKPAAKNAPTQGVKFHAATSIPNSNSMYIFTGMASSLLILDADTWEWTTAPGPLSDPSENTVGSTLVSSGNFLLAYGGVHVNSDYSLDTSKVSDALYVYDLSSRKWILRPNGNKLYFHSSCASPGVTESIIFGGATTGGDLVSSVISLSTSAYQFYLNRPSSQSPPQLIGATLNCIGSTGVLIGGGGSNWKPSSSPIQVINNTGAINPSNPEFLWSQPNIQNGAASPGARIGHSSADSDGNIYIFGGLGEGDTGVYKLNTQSWGWEALISPLAPLRGSTATGGSSLTPTIVIAIVAALFGILTMGVIIAVGLRHWRKKNPVLTPPVFDNGSPHGPSETRAWTDSQGNTPARNSTHSNSHSGISSLEGRVPYISHISLPSSGLRHETQLEDEAEGWTAGETAYSVMSGQDDSSSVVAPVRYVRPLSPIHSQQVSLGDCHNEVNNHASARNHFSSISETTPWIGMATIASTRAYPAAPFSESPFRHYNSCNDMSSPLDRIVRLQSSLNSPNEIMLQSELSTPTSSIQNWPFTNGLTSNMHEVYGVGSQQSIGSLNHMSKGSYSAQSPDFPGCPGLELSLQQKLAEKYRIISSFLTQTRGNVFSLFATEILTLAPVSIRIYHDRKAWEHATEMLQILEGQFLPKLLETFIVTTSADFYVLITERLGTTLPGILCRQSRPFSNNDLCFLVKSITIVVDFCHSRGVVLTDLQPADFAFSSEDPSLLMLVSTDSCHIERDYYSHKLPPRYCPPELADSFITDGSTLIEVMSYFDSWALGCLIYELYSRKPVLGSQVSEAEALRFLTQGSYQVSRDHLSSGVSWKSGVLSLPAINTLPAGIANIVLSLLQYHPQNRRTTTQILEQPFFITSPASFSIFASLPHPLPFRLDTGEINEQTASQAVALRKQIVATSEIQVPRLPIILPTIKASSTWMDPSSWDDNTFHIYFLCEGAPGLHFSNHPGIPLTNPTKFLSKTGLLISMVSQLCVLYLSPDLFGQLDHNSFESLLASHSDPEAYFTLLSQTLEMFCSSAKDPILFDFAKSLTFARKPDNLNIWLAEWVLVAREALTSMRHIALQEVRDLLVSNQNVGLVYTRSLTTQNFKNSSVLPTTWHTWLCSTHNSKTSY